MTSRWIASVRAALLPALRGVRWREWYASKIPFVWTACAAAALTSPLASGEILRRGAIVLAFTCLCAAFGHWANDYADRECDQLAGKRNAAGAMRPRTAKIVLLLLAVAALAALAPLAASGAAVAAGVAELVVAGAYSLPPLRLKTRRAAGVWAAAAAQRTLPMVVAFTALGPMTAGAWLLLAVAQLAGTRWVLVHQVNDAESDRGAAVTTWVSVVGEERAFSFLRTVILPLEVLLLLLCVALQASTAPRLWLLPVAAIVASSAWSWHCRGVQAPYSLRGYGRQPLAAFYEFIWPLGLSIELALARPTMWTLVLALMLWQHRYVWYRIAEWVSVSRRRAPSRQVSDP